MKCKNWLSRFLTNLIFLHTKRYTRNVFEFLNFLRLLLSEETICNFWMVRWWGVSQLLFFLCSSNTVRLQKKMFASEYWMRAQTLAVRKQDLFAYSDYWINSSASAMFLSKHILKVYGTGIHQYASTSCWDDGAQALSLRFCNHACIYVNYIYPAYIWMGGVLAHLTTLH